MEGSVPFLLGTGFVGITSPIIDYLSLAYVLSCNIGCLSWSTGTRLHAEYLLLSVYVRTDYLFHSLEYFGKEVS